MTRTTLYVAPHLDDVALSCAGGVLARVRRGERVVICSIFTRTRHRTIEQRRAAEDLAACTLAGATRIDLGYDDAPDRTHRTPPTFHTLVLDAPLDRALVADLRAAIGRQIRALAPDELWFPLGIGGHLDHRTTFAARPTAATRVPTFFYADRPYAFVPALVARRIAELTGHPPRALTAATIARQFTAGAMASFVGPDERAAAFAALASPPRAPTTPLSLTPHVARHPIATLAPALAMIAAYRSQIRVIFGDTLAATYRRHTASPSHWRERFYTLDPIRASDPAARPRAGRARR